MKTILSATLSLALFGAAHAAILNVPTTTVLAVNSAGSTFTVNGNFGASDTLSLLTSGTVDLANGNFTSQAAGIVVAPPTTNTGVHPGGVSPNDGTGTNFGSLLIGNSTLGFFQIYPSNAANGLGNPTPPTTLYTNATLGSIFGPGVTLANGSSLTLVVSDCPNCFGDNSGSFQVTTTPEPATLGLIGAGIAGLGLLRRRRA